ncbi:MAG: hypothetical protein ACLFTO_05825 [Candidatus Acetothermia bacterium]
MDVEFKVESGQLRRDGPAINAAIDKYTSPFWPFGRKKKAHKKLVEKQEELLQQHGIEKDSQLNYTVLKVHNVDSSDEAKDKINSFEGDLNSFYRDELDFDPPPLEVSRND